MNVNRIPNQLRVAAGFALALTLLAAPMAQAQTPAAMDRRADLVEMPFELDVPVVRTSVQHNGDQLAFFNHSSLPYQAAVDHYAQYYISQDELGPGWTIIGYGFDMGANVMAFTLKYAQQSYRLEVVPDEQTGGSIVILRGQARALGYRPQRHSVAPYRATDVGPVTY